ncbi:PKD domain-containing protein [Methanosphaerula subterraneus]|uniref:PKD domain-containing protein n=1 Tax=Methanosphaerula subterraneus TaxID=3350244 RepID=UPI003F86F64B
MSYRKAGEFLLLLIILIAALATPAMAGLVLPNDTGTGAAINPESLSLPLSFIENQGQAPDAVKYQVNAAGHSIAFEPDRIVLTASQDVNETTRSAEVTMTFPGSSASPAIAGLDRLPGSASFFLGNDSTKWRSDVPIFGSIEYQQLYPGVDLRYNGTQGVLKREFVVAPGASPNQIAIAYDGIDGLALAENGSLAITTSLGVLTDEAPVAYQAIDGVKVPVTSSYRLKDDGTVGFTVGAYDQSRPLIIDPTLLYSSFYWGHPNYTKTAFNQVCVGQTGNIYLAGVTNFGSLPVQNAYQGSMSGTQDAFVAELNPEGNQVLYLSYLGGSGLDCPQGLGVDNAGNIYLAGGTRSDNFPLQSPFQTARNDSYSAFVTKLNPSNPSGSQLVYSSYLGNNGAYSSSSSTGISAIVVDSSGNAYVSGSSKSATGAQLPVTADAAQPTSGGGTDAYLAKIPSDGSLTYLTYLGGSGTEGTPATSGSNFLPVMGLGFDPAGNIYVAGRTVSTDFPVLNAYQSANGGSNDIFVVKYSPSGSKVYATYLGGSGDDYVGDLATDASGAVYLTGYTLSTNFPMQNPAQGTINGSQSVYITKLAPSGSALDYSTYWGGTGSSQTTGFGIVVNDAGEAYIDGRTDAMNFPLINGSQSSYGGGACDGFVVKFSTAGNTALYSTLIGGEYTDELYGIALDHEGNVIVCGDSQSNGYPTTTSAYLTTNPGGLQLSSILTILTDKAVAGFTATPTSGYAPLAVQFNDTSAGSPTNWSWDFGDNTTSTEQNPAHTYTATGLYSVNLTASSSAGSTHILKTDYITVLDQPALPAANFTANVTTGIAPLTVQFTDTSLGENLTAWSWNFGDGNLSTEQNPVHTYALTGNYTVNLTVTNTSGSNSSVKADYILVSTQPQPVANFTANVTTGTAPLAVQFNDTSLGENLTAWSWAFGDGNTSTEQNPINNYTTAGTYTVNLTVTNATGSNSSVKTNYITVTASEAPTADFIANITNGTTPLTVQFNDTSVGANLTNWSWDFTNDGLVDSIEQNPIFNYTTAGSYTVNLTVTNATGSDSEVKAGFITVSAPVVPTVAPVTGVIPASSNVNLLVANSAGARFDDYGNDTYNFFNTGQSATQGFNALHITTDPVTTESGQVTTSGSQSGTFYITDTGGRGWDDDGVLMLAVNGAIPDDFKVNIHASGYTWTPVLTGSYPTFGGVTLSPDALNETFTKADFIYGPQIWRPSPGTATMYPIYNAQDMTNTTDTFSLMFIDLNAGILGGGTRGQASFSGQTLANNGAIRVDYTFENLTTSAAFDAYAYAVSSNQGQGIRWTNRLSDTGASGFMVTALPPALVAGFTANVTNGAAPLAVQFTDASTGSPTSWSWDFGDGNTSAVQSPVHNYTVAGNYTVNLTATNAGGSNTSVKTNYIRVTSLVTPTPTITPVAGGVLPDYNNIFVRVANDAGVQYDAFGNDSYNIRFEGYDRGLNALHITTDPAVNFGQVTQTAAQSGTFYATDSGGKGYEDEILLLVGVNGTVPDDFKLHVSADGYTWTPNTVRNTAPTSYTYNGTTLDETFTKADLVYGPQTWRPTGNGLSYPIYAGQDTADAGNTFQLMFIDLNAGVLRPNTTLQNQGAVRITYSFENLTSLASFNVYGYCQTSNNGDDMVAWSNSLMPDKAPSGYSVTAPSPAPVAGFTANTTNGTAPLAVGFTDQSTGSPTSWSWSFGDGNTSIEQSPAHNYTSAGNYTVNLTVTNAGGSDSEVKTDFITVAELVTPTTTATTTPTVTPTTPPKTFFTVGASGCDFTTLTDALNSASVVDGDTVYVYNGTYLLTSTGITKSITLRGEDANSVTIDLSGLTGPITGNGTIFENLRFTKGLLSFPSVGGGATNMIIRNCIFEDMKNPGSSSGAIKLFGTNNTISGNVFKNNAVYNVIYLTGTNNIVENNIFTNTTSVATIRGVVRLAAGSGAIVRNNSFSGNSMPCVLILSSMLTPRVYLNNFDVPSGTSPVAVQGVNDAPSFPWSSPTAITYTYQNVSYTKALGNFYTSYSGVDADGDGIGDTSYRLTTNQIDSAPLMDRTQFYLGSSHSPTASVSVIPASATVNVSETKQFAGKAIDSDGLNVPGLNYTWSSSNETVGTISQTGLFTARAPGSANITASNGGISNTSIVTVLSSQPLPVADFTANVTSGSLPLTVQFIDASTGSPTAWAWDFTNDGTVDATTQNPIFTYPARGTYSVNLTVSNSDGTNSTIKSNYIAVSGATTWTVGASGCDFTTLPAAMSAAVDGDSIYVYNGTYSFSALSKNNIRITGEGADLVTINLGGTGYQVQGSGSIFEQVKFTNGRISLPSTAPVAQNIIIRNCIFEGMKSTSPAPYGLSVLGQNNTFQNNMFRNNAVACVIRVGSGPNNSMKNNTFMNNGPSGTSKAVLEIYTAANPVIIENNIFKDNTYSCIYVQNLMLADTAITLNDFIVPDGVTPIKTFGTIPAISWVTSTTVPYTYQGTSHTGVLGNYWSTYSGTDANEDGIGDTPYNTGVSTQVDSAPLMDRTQFYFGASHSATAVSVIPASATVNVSETKQFAGKATDSDGLNVPGLNYTWSSSNETVGNISEIGLFTAHAPGSVTITASTGGISNTSVVTVLSSQPLPVADFTANVTNGTSPLSVGFTDRSTGSPTSWSWSFGDGNTSTLQNPSHTYTVAGNYTVNLTATNAGGSNTSVRTDYITVTTPVTPAPVAGFSANVTNGTAPIAVGFTDQSTGSPTSWSWSFGDGGTSTLQSPSHTYAVAGTYTVNLTATNAGGSNTSTRTGYITVRAPATPTTVATTIATTIPTTIATTVPTTVPTTTTVTPTPTATQQPVVANFTANVTAGQSPLAVQFTDLTTGSIRQYFWQFGDGGASFDQNPVHIYTAAGTYTVSLVAIGSTGSQVKTIAQYITVTAPGTPTQTVTPTVTSTTPTTTTVIPTPTVTTTIPVTTTVTPLPTSPGHDLPIANFVVTYLGGAGSMGIQVTDASTNATTVKYDLGDGTTTAYKNFRYTYWQPGTYTIKLTATNDAGTTEKTVTVTVPAGSPTTTTVTPTVTVTTPAPTTTTVTPTQTSTDPNLPVANFTVTFPGGLGSMGIQVTNTAVNATSVRYNLGDGATTAYPNFTYTYWQSGNYTINQTATNAAGSTNKTLVVTVPAVSTPTTIPTTIPTTTTVSPTATTTGPVYNGTHLIPGQLQAEDYDLGGEGVAYHDTTAGNEGGVYRHDDVDIETLDTDRSPNVGWVRTGEWLAYTVNIGTAGTYDAGFRVASSHAGSSVQVYLDDGTTPVATVNVPNTGDWLAFQTVQVPVALPAGQHRLKLAFPTDYANINWIDFTPRA